MLTGFARKRKRARSLAQAGVYFCGAAVNLRVEPVELAHAERQVRLRGLGDEVMVIVHQAVGVAEPDEAVENVREYRKEARAAADVVKDALARVSARD